MEVLVLTSISSNNTLNELIERCCKTPNTVFTAYLTNKPTSFVKLQRYGNSIMYDLYIPSTNVSVKSPYITDIVDICEEHIGLINTQWRKVK